MRLSSQMTLLIVLLLFSGLLSGCAALIPTAPTVATSVGTTAGSEYWRSEGFPPTGGTVDAKPDYLDFDHILLPSGLGVEQDQSRLFKVGKLKGGLLALKGSLDLNSLMAFFRQSMPADGWKIMGEFTYPQATLFFSRPGKACIITMYETMVYTHVRIWVTPTS